MSLPGGRNSGDGRPQCMDLCNKGKVAVEVVLHWCGRDRLNGLCVNWHWCEPEALRFVKNMQDFFAPWWTWPKPGILYCNLLQQFPWQCCRKIVSFFKFKSARGVWSKKASQMTVQSCPLDWNLVFPSWFLSMGHFLHRAGVFFSPLSWFLSMGHFLHRAGAFFSTQLVPFNGAFFCITQVLFFSTQLIPFNGAFFASSRCFFSTQLIPFNGAFFASSRCFFLHSVDSFQWGIFYIK